MSWAALTSRATLGLASNVCGSVFGLFRMDETWTYFPPIWERTLAYSFSAPTALITPGVLPPAAAGPQAAAAVPRQARAKSDGRAHERRRAMLEEEGRLFMRQPYTETESQYKTGCV